MAGVADTAGRKRSRNSVDDAYAALEAKGDRYSRQYEENRNAGVTNRELNILYDFRCKLKVAVDVLVEVAARVKRAKEQDVTEMAASAAELAERAQDVKDAFDDMQEAAHRLGAKHAEERERNIQRGYDY